MVREKDPAIADLEIPRSHSAPPKTALANLSTRWRLMRNLSPSVARSRHVIIVVGTAIIIAAAISQFAAAWLGLPRPVMAYRRIGPQTGPQVFCAGSSVVQFGLSWPEISNALGQGIENWGLGGSTPSEWEVSQSLATNTDLTIIGLSLHDLNEHFLCDFRANIVPITQAIQDLRQSKADWQFSKRLLSQYPLAYLRILFPTAEKSDAVLVGLRRKARELMGSSPSAEEKAGFLVLPSGSVLNFADAIEKVSDWPKDKALRRLDLLRNKIQGLHWFDGPKHLAFLRMLERAQRRGRVIVVVVPVAPMYADKFLTPEVNRSFEKSLADGYRVAPDALFVRLDQLSALNSNEYFSDFVHLNGAGKRIATEAFLRELHQNFRRP
jgi:hypothetical protein